MGWGEKEGRIGAWEGGRGNEGGEGGGKGRGWEKGVGGEEERRGV